MNKRKTAKHFGVTVQTVDAWMLVGCPYQRDGRKLDFDPDEVAAWREKRAAPEREREVREVIEADLCSNFYPKLCDAPEFINFLLNALRDENELGLTKAQALRVYQLVIMALTLGFRQTLTLSYEHEFTMGELTQAIIEAGGPEAYAREHWPDAASDPD